MRCLMSVFLGLLCVFWLTSAKAAVQIDIDLSRQSMSVSSANGHFTWPISSARSGYSTPNGRFAPYSLQAMHYSRKYHLSPMPYSIFFLGGYAIHGTASVAQLGRPASHGCIRLAPAQAAKLFQMVKAEGASIAITGKPPGHLYAKAKTKLHHYAAAGQLQASHVAAYSNRVYAARRLLRADSTWSDATSHMPLRQIPYNVRAYDEDGAYTYRGGPSRVRAWQYAPTYGW